MQEKNYKLQYQGLIFSGFLSLLTAPLVTSHIALQLSIKEHKNKYGDANRDAKTQELAHVKKDITVQDRRKFELLVKSGSTGTNRPFRAPVYLSYSEVFRALAKQGVLGFYKGNLAGLVHLYFTQSTKFMMFGELDYTSYTWWHDMNPFKKGVFISFLSGSIDILFHPLMTI